MDSIFSEEPSSNGRQCTRCEKLASIHWFPQVFAHWIRTDSLWRANLHLFHWKRNSLISESKQKDAFRHQKCVHFAFSNIGRSNTAIQSHFCILHWIFLRVCKKKERVEENGKSETMLGAQCWGNGFIKSQVSYKNGKIKIHINAT